MRISSRHIKNVKVIVHSAVYLTKHRPFYNMREVYLFTNNIQKAGIDRRTSYVLRNFRFSRQFHLCIHWLTSFAKPAKTARTPHALSMNESDRFDTTENHIFDLAAENCAC